MLKILKIFIIIFIATFSLFYKLTAVWADTMINVIVVASPSVLTTSGGLVTYGYQVFNPGPSLNYLTNINLTDDKCSPVTYTGGDLNNDSRLDREEVWKYTCKVNLSTTTTNMVTATGISNAQTFTATATSTVAVATSNLSIKVTKKATPEQIFAEKGQVVYSYDVTNPGTLTLENVTLTDDKCSPVSFAIGDNNSNGKLEPGEDWKYICNATLTATTTNNATARGQSGGNYVTDVTSDTVVVGKSTKPDIDTVVPKGLPKSGGGGAATDSSWSWLLAPLILLGLMISKKKIFNKLNLEN